MMTKFVFTCLSLVFASASGTHVSAATAAPNAPGAPIAQAGDTSATVAVPSATTGDAADRFTVTASPGGATCEINNATAPNTNGRVCTITGLTNGVAYTFTATATNTSGSSPASAGSNSVTPEAEALVGLARYTATNCANGGGALSPDGKYLYLLKQGSASQTGRLVKIRTSDMVAVSESGDIGVVDCTYPRMAAAIDSDGEFMVLGARLGLAKISLNGTSDAAPTVITELPGTEYQASPVFDATGDYAYFLAKPASAKGRIDKVLVSSGDNLSVQSSAEFDMWSGAGIIRSGNTGYVGYDVNSSDSNGRILSFDMTSTPAFPVFPLATRMTTFTGNEITKMTTAPNGYTYVGRSAATGNVFGRIKLSVLPGSDNAGYTNLLTNIPATCSSIIYAISISESGKTLILGTDAESSKPECLIRFRVDPTTGAITDALVADTITVDSTPINLGRPQWLLNGPDGTVGYVNSNNTIISVQLATTPYSLPDPAVAVATDTALGGSLNVAWTAPTDTGGLPVTGYLVEIATSANGPWSVTAGTCNESTTRTSTSTSCTISELTNGTAYFTRVSAINAAGVTATSDRQPTEAATPTGPARAPDEFGITSGDKKLDISWVAPSDTGGFAITWYFVEIATSANGPWTDPAGSCAAATTSVSTATSCTITGLSNGIEYHVRISPITSAGTGQARVVAGTPLNTTSPTSSSGTGSTGSGSSVTDSKSGNSNATLPSTGGSAATSIWAILLVIVGGLLMMASRLPRFGRYRR